MKTAELEPSQASPPGLQGVPGVVVIHSPDASLAQRFFSLQHDLVIGRREGPERASCLEVADSRISRDHVSLRWRSDGNGAEVRDLESRNGTSLNGRRISSEHAPIGSLLRIGDTFVEIAVQVAAAASHPLIRGQSAVVQRLVGELHRVAHSDASVLVEGETGTGKELVAQALHDLGGRSGKLVAINCASIPAELAESYLFGHKKGAFTGAAYDAEGLFDQARDGTLFLDEIGELRLDLQAKLLRVLETRQFSPVGTTQSRTTNARFVSATNAKLRVQVVSGTFRADLFARLAGIELEAPALRHRRSDIPLLMQHFFGGAAPQLSANAMESLLLHDWPMNVRELKAVCGRLALAQPAGAPLRTADVAQVLRVTVAGTTPEPPPSLPSREELSALLQAHQGNVAKVAAHFDKDRRQLYRWLQQHGLDPRDFR